ncbi:MAG: hypothetical protein WAN74_06405 [Thermoplasmata archaeon]
MQGNVDVVYGAKGAGKSALYILLTQRGAELAQRKILAIEGENPRGAPVFQDLVTDPPTTEAEFRLLWKLYALTIIGQRFRAAKLEGPNARRIIGYLEGARLLGPTTTLKAILKAAHEYARMLLRAEAMEAGVSISPLTGVPAISGKITFREPTTEQRQDGYVSVDELLARANDLLKQDSAQVWILLDRLDVAFSESDELEANALRALFRSYRDLGNLDAIRFKIFMRSDIWRRITEGQGFREASHIGRQLTISWDPNALLNLVIRRVLQNQSIRETYQVDESTLSSLPSQRELFYRIFPLQIDVGERRPETFDWILSRTADGKGASAPREILQLLTSARDTQLRRWEIGEADPEGERLFDRNAFKQALLEVSRMRLERTLLAEYPTLRERILALEGEKTQQTPESLAALWRVTLDEASSVAGRLVEAGFFEVRGSKAAPEFWVPFLYRGALKMVQGTAD